MEYQLITPRIPLKNLGAVERVLTNRGIALAEINHYLNTTDTLQLTKLTNSCASYIPYGAYQSITGILKVKCTGESSHEVQIYRSYKGEGTELFYTTVFSVESEGEYDIALNIPLLRMSYYQFDGFECYIYVTGDVDCDFSNVIVEANNYNSNNIDL